MDIEKKDKLCGIWKIKMQFIFQQLFLSVLSNRQEEVAVSRLRIGHSKLTYRYLIERQQVPLCTQCHLNTPITLNITK